MAEEYAHSGFALGAGAKTLGNPFVSGIRNPAWNRLPADEEYGDLRQLNVAMSNAYGSPVKDAKAKYLDDLKNIPGLEVKVRNDTKFTPMLGTQPLRGPGEPDPPQQTVGEAIKQALDAAIKQALDAKAAARAAEEERLAYNERIKNIPGVVPMNSDEDYRESLKQQWLKATADYNGKKDQPPMDKTEVAVMIDEAKREMRSFVHERIDFHNDFYHTTQIEEKPRSRAPWYIAGYALAALGTFVHLQHYNDSFSKITDKGDKVFLSIVVPPFWPVYWAGTGLYYVGQGMLALDDYATNALKSTPKAPAKSCTDDKSGSWAPDADGICHMPALPGAQ